MFPYRHTDPTVTTPGAVGDRRRRRRTTANDDDLSQHDSYVPSWEEALEGGGLLQMAMKGDLLDFRRYFESTLADALGSAEGRNSGRGDDAAAADASIQLRHQKAGSAFQVFLGAFGRAKMAALLHSKWAPPVCDRGSYSQLIYATCLSLLRDAMDSDEGDHDRSGDVRSVTGHGPTVQLVRSAFALFTLYAMYETNPLKRSDDRIPRKPRDRMMSMLPTSISYPREYMHVRRAFRRPIRVDVDTYQILYGALPDRARQHVARCEMSRCRCLKSRVSMGSPSTLHAAQNVRDWRCSCAVAKDVIEVLRRLQPHWDFASYTGPCGLEAMAGHPDYPWSTAAEELAELSGSRPPGVQDPPVLDAENATSDGFALDEDELTGKMREYLRCCSEVRFPAQATQRIERAREAIRPIFTTSNRDSSDAAPDIAQLVDAAVNGPADAIPASAAKKRSIAIKRRHVTFSIDVPDDRASTSRSIQPPAEDRAAHGADQHEDEANGQVNATEVSHELVLPKGLTEMQEQSLADAVETILKRGDFSSGPGIIEAHSHAQSDEVSTLGDITALHSRASGVGRSALQALLAQAGLPSKAATKPPRAVITGDSFLDAMDDEASLRQAAGRLMGAGSDIDLENGEMSDLSDDGLSVAASAVGRKALDALILRSTRGGAVPTSTSRSPQPKRSRNSQSTGANSRAAGKGSVDSDGESIDVLEDASMAASTVGQKALADLLSIGQGKEELNHDDDSNQSSAVPLSHRASDSHRSESSSQSGDSAGLTARTRREQSPSRKDSPERGTSTRQTERADSSKRTLRSAASANQKQNGSNGSSSMPTRRSNGQADDSPTNSRDASSGAGQQALDDLLSGL